MRALQAELLKLATLPSAWLAAALALLLPAGLSVLNVGYLVRELAAGADPGAVLGPDVGYDVIAFAVVGVIVLGVVAMGSEFREEEQGSAAGRQILASLGAVPGRAKLLWTKTLALALSSAMLAVLAILGTFPLLAALFRPLGLVIAPDPWRLFGLSSYWVMTALLAFAFTALLRNGLVPLMVLVLNNSLVSLSYLLTRVTPLASYLPDVAGMRMFARGLELRPDATSVVHASHLVEMHPLTGGVVMLAWVLLLLGAAGFGFQRRDA